MKVYLSGPISHNPDAEEQFSKAEEKVKLWAEEVSNPMQLGQYCPVKDNWAELMKNAIKLMMECDSIYLIRGWGSSKGAIMEKFIAEELDMPIFYEEKGKMSEEWDQDYGQGQI
tara:strand:+ start:746 stop:1087 length:342 start_codon:yes stop_codon:yes gene_type:complete